MCTPARNHTAKPTHGHIQFGRSLGQKQHVASSTSLERAYFTDCHLYCGAVPSVLSAVQRCTTPRAWAFTPASIQQHCVVLGGLVRGPGHSTRASLGHDNQLTRCSKKQAHGRQHPHHLAPLFKRAMCAPLRVWLAFTRSRPTLSSLGLKGGVCPVFSGALPRKASLYKTAYV